MIEDITFQEFICIEKDKSFVTPLTLLKKKDSGYNTMRNSSDLGVLQLSSTTHGFIGAYGISKLKNSTNVKKPNIMFTSFSTENMDQEKSSKTLNIYTDMQIKMYKISLYYPKNNDRLMEKI